MCRAMSQGKREEKMKENARRRALNRARVFDNSSALGEQDNTRVSSMRHQHAGIFIGRKIILFYFLSEVYRSVREIRLCTRVCHREHAAV